MNDLSGRISWADVALALLLEGVSLVVSRVRRTGLERDIGIATLRSFSQLLAVGYVLDFVFRSHGALTPVVLLVMIVPAVPRAVIPLGSMIISNAMNTTSLVMARLRDDLGAHRREVEAHLSLGETASEAAAWWHQAAVRNGMLPIVDQTKVVGLVALPGAMTGML